MEENQYQKFCETKDTYIGVLGVFSNILSTLHHIFQLSH